MLHKVCEICQSEFETQSGKKKYCTDDCYKEARRRQARTPEQQARGARKKQRQRDCNPEHQREILRKSQEKHREKRYAETREWARNNREHRREYTRQYRVKNPNRSKEHAQYYQTHKEQISTRVSAYIKANPDVLQLKNARRRAFKKNAQGDWTREQFKELCEQVDWCCAYCFGKFDKLTPDHIIPLSRGGSNDISNIIPACGPCNYSKQHKTPLEYLTRFN